MRILMLNHNQRGRSTYFRCMAYGRQLVRLGHAVDLFTISPTRRRGFTSSTEDGINVIETPDITTGLARSGWDPWDTLHRIWFLRNSHYDVVHGFDGRPVVRFPARFVQRRRTPYVSDWADWWGRGGVIAQRKGFFLRHVFAPIETYFEESCRPLADHVTVISTALAERAHGLGIPSDRITRLPGGAEPDRVRRRDRLASRQALGLSRSDRILAYAGFVQYDIEFVLNAFRLVAALRNDVKLFLIGPPVKVPWADSVGRRVVQTGVLDPESTLTYLASADILLLPFLPTRANLGRWPNKAGEYMCLGQPIITNPVGDVQEIVNADAAIGTAPDADSYARAILGLLEDTEGRQALGQRARHAAETRFNYATRVKILEEVYQQALARNG